jgi:Cof subfamily protein (haloacid dehalogenase superfamily)
MSPNKNRAFDLIAVDCDGTLLTSSKEISHGAKEAIDKAKAAGIEIVLITGRNLDAIEFIRESLDLNDLIVGCDGTFIYDPLKDEVVEKHTLPMAKTKELIRICRRLDVFLFLEYINFALFEKISAEMERSNFLHDYNREKVTDLLQKLEEEPVKAMVISKEDFLKTAVDEISRQHLFNNMVFTSPSSADYLPDGINKGTGLKSVSRIKDIPLERIAVIGDWLNDVSMFQVSGFSIAMGNAPAELKAHADLIAPTNDEGGVVWALEQLIER